MNDELMNIVKRLENEFDTSFKRLLEKCEEYSRINHCRCCCQNDYDKIINDNDNDNQEVVENHQDDESENMSTKSVSSKSFTSIDDVDYYSNNETTTDDDDDDEQQTTTLIEQLEPELIHLALSEAKLMTKTFLFAEQLKHMQQEIDQLRMENFHLKNKLKSTVWQHTIDFNSSAVTQENVDDDDDDEDKNDKQLSHGNVEDEVDDIDGSNSRSSNIINSNSKCFEIISQREQQPRQQLDNRFNRKQQQQLAGRVQQLQLFYINDYNQSIGGGSGSRNHDDNVDDEMNKESLSSSSSLPPLSLMNNPAYQNIWKQLSFEIELNRFKTLIRLAEYDDDDDDEDYENENEVEKSSIIDTDKELQSILLNKTGIELNWKFFNYRSSSSMMNQNQSIMERKQQLERMGQIYFINLYIKSGEKLGLTILGEGRTALNGHFRIGDIILALEQEDMIDKTPEDLYELINRKYNGKWCRFGILRIPSIHKHHNSMEPQFNFELFYDDPFELRSH
ncbi:hypothetical protein DERF_001742 [Dermatophagoides farinae]|uniref:PDZ domain-containing protein n=1 Tax=Dermatophagoides farinae TaxID=6954 RepID=A0A922ICE0_DERFA|nr:hypothetical protein DERF_001742 [Dermatophagoides farinae]